MLGRVQASKYTNFGSILLPISQNIPSDINWPHSSNIVSASIGIEVLSQRTKWYRIFLDMGVRSIFNRVLLLLVACILGIGCQEQVHKRQLVMESQLNRQLVTFIDSCWNNKDIRAIQDLTTSDFVRNMNGIRVARNQQEMEAHMKVFFKAFPDLKVSVEETDVKGNKVFLLWQSKGTNTGIYGEMAATGKKVKINGLSQLYFNEAGKLYREDVYFNELDLLQQLGYSLNPPNLE